MTRRRRQNFFIQIPRGGWCRAPWRRRLFFCFNFSLGQAPSDRQGALTFCGDLPKPTEKQGGSNSLRKVWDRSYEGTLGFARPLSKRDDKFKVDSGQITRVPSAPKFTDHAPKILILQIARIPSPKEVRSHIGSGL